MILLRKMVFATVFCNIRSGRYQNDPECICTDWEIYIADGHHRAASAVKVGFKRREEHPGYTGKEEFNYFLSVLFPDEELMIMDYNRVVRDLGGMTEEAFLSKMQELFDVQKIENGNDVRPVKRDNFPCSFLINGIVVPCARSRFRMIR